MKKLLLFFFLSFSICNSGFAEIRYVSHSGSNTPPYLTWETAADSIMSAINVSSFGDTIYVANGIYEEQVVMIPGLSLIGAGMDSCVISLQGTGIPTVTVVDSCLLKGFQIITLNTLNTWGIKSSGSNSLIAENKIINPSLGIYLDNSDAEVYNNILENIKTKGVWAFNSNSSIRMNNISTDPNSQAASVAGIDIEAYDFTYTPVIDSNYIWVGTNADGISKAYGARPIISNNIITIKHSNTGIYLSNSDSAKVFNNLIMTEESAYQGIYSVVQNLSLCNNYFRGRFSGQAIMTGPNSIVENNSVINAAVGIGAWSNENLTVKYNNLWHNTSNYSGFTGDTTNLSVDPMVVNDDTSKGELDYHLQMFSPLIDRGDPGILDKDSTRSDIGLYGGPFGEIYSYQDLPPRQPVNLSASVDTDYILIRWNKNTEADINHYNLYRDTTENFTIDSTTFVVSVTDTFYLHIRPGGINNLYFKLTAVDNQGNTSEPSEELHIVLTGTKNNEEFTINNYKLFQNYPNPFNPTTRIAYRLKERGYVKLYVYDIKGELVETLVNKIQDRGYYEVEFTGSPSGSEESTAQRLASGIYIYQILVQNEHNIPVFSDIKKMVYLK